MSEAWVEANATSFDLFHCHFNFGDISLQDLERFISALRLHSKPLVFTVHDLVNAQTDDQEHHVSQVTRLLTYAAEVITLTTRASQRVMEIYARDATVIPHPHVVDFDTIRDVARTQSSRRQDETLKVGVHLKNLRPGISGTYVVRGLTELLATRTWLRIVIDIHSEALINLPAHEPDLRSFLAILASHSQVQVSVHDRHSDAELWKYLASLDLVVLPYRLGTHSGWAEACLDLGAAVAAPSHTCIASQHPTIASYDFLDLSSLARIVDEVYYNDSRSPWTARTRLEQRRHISLEHRRIYERAIELR